MRPTQLTEAIAWTEETTDIVVSSPQIRRRKGLFGVLMMRKSGARFTVPRDMIWKSVRLFWIGRRCHQQQRRCHKSPGELISVG
jgi:hypothetical protein